MCRDIKIIAAPFHFRLQLARRNYALPCGPSSSQQRASIGKDGMATKKQIGARPFTILSVYDASASAA